MKNSSSNIVVIAVCLMVSMTSCVFAPKDIYKSEDKKSAAPPEVTCTVDLSVSQDTVYVNAKADYSYNSYYSSSSNTIVFNFKCNTGDVIQVKSIIDENDKNARIYINDKYPTSTRYSSNYSYVYSTFDSNSNSISVYASDLSLGTHTLELQFIAKSGSGSIADNLGAEGFVTKKWTIIAVSTNYAVKDTVLNGFEKLYWGAYKGSDFKEYVVKGMNETFEKHLRTNYLIDSSYVGQGRTYSVSVVKKDGTSISIGSLTIDKKLVAIKPAYIKGLGMFLKLENIEYYNAIDSIFIVLPNYSDSIVIRKKYNHDTAFAIEGVINESYSGTIKVVPKDRSSYSQNSYKYEYQNYIYSLKLGHPFITSSNFYIEYFAAISNDEFIYTSNKELYRYSISELKSYSPAVKVCNKSNYWLSSSKKTLFYLDECDLKLKALSTADGITSLKTYTTSSYSPTAGLLAISDVVTKLTYNSQNYEMSVTNINTGQIIAKSDSLTQDAYSVSGRLSSDGKYVLFNTYSNLNLYSVSENKFTQIWNQFCDYNNYYEFNSENNDEFVCHLKSTFSIKSTKTGEDLESYWLGDEVFSVDFKNNQMLTYNSPYLRVRNLKDGSLIKEFKTSYCYKGDVILSNNVLIFKSGVLYFVK